MAMNIISKEKKEIRWIGLPTNSAQECQNLEVKGGTWEILVWSHVVIIELLFFRRGIFFLNLNMIGFDTCALWKYKFWYWNKLKKYVCVCLVQFHLVCITFSFLKKPSSLPYKNGHWLNQGLFLRLKSVVPWINQKKVKRIYSSVMITK